MRDEPAGDHPERAVRSARHSAHEPYRAPGSPTRLPLSALDRALALSRYLFLVSPAVGALYGLWLIATGHSKTKRPA